MSVFIHNNIKWINYQGVLIPDVAPHIKIILTKKDTQHLLAVSGAYFLRWVSNWDCSESTEFWHVIKDGSSSLEELSGNTRHNVRRGMKRCQFTKVDIDVILEEGYAVYIKAFMYYETFIEPMTKEAFLTDILALQNQEEWDFWEARNDEGQMIAYSINKVYHNMCAYKTTKFDPDFQRLYTSEGLFYTMNSYYLNECGVKYIDDGSRSLSHQTAIQDYFIHKFKYRKAYCELHMEYTSKIKLVVNILFPFRRWIEKSEHPIAQKITVLLRHEAIRRSFES